MPMIFTFSKLTNAIKLKSCIKIAIGCEQSESLEMAQKTIHWKIQNTFFVRNDFLCNILKNRTVARHLTKHFKNDFHLVSSTMCTNICECYRLLESSFKFGRAQTSTSTPKNRSSKRIWFLQLVNVNKH